MRKRKRNRKPRKFPTYGIKMWYYTAKQFATSDRWRESAHGRVQMFRHNNPEFDDNMEAWWYGVLHAERAKVLERRKAERKAQRRQVKGNSQICMLCSREIDPSVDIYMVNW